MKRITVSLAIAASALLLSSPAMAFHDGGVAHCEGCHTMHNSVNNAPISTTLGGKKIPLDTSGTYLLQGSTQSEACLNCHESTPGSYHISTPANTNTAGASANGYITQFSPGGDFRWLTYVTSNSQGGGHAINAPAYGYGAANVPAALSTAPGGGANAYPVGSLNCSSCHDPHGKYRRTDNTDNFVTTGAPIYSSGSYGGTGASIATAVGSYRLLAGSGYIPKSLGTSVTPFTAAPPVAVAPTTYNVSATTLNGNVRVSYGSGMSEWCANCHGAMHSSSSYTSGQSTTGTVHPAGQAAGSMGSGAGSIVANYDAYVTSGIMTGTDTTSYQELVPYETGDTTFSSNLIATSAFSASGLTGSALTGPTSTFVTTQPQVMCLSCHRAHATGFHSMLRFDDAEFVTTLSSGTPVYNTSRTSLSSVADTQTAYYNRPASVFGANGYQRMLCNKCHAKD
jgi:hypothetical protein